ncbi:MAG: hypothetical protein LBD23_17610 [Oscillospiraceae bacterium]|jgi:hypothetical protein|nr:hypothetical protein [Oscillospiraceae bacterium]
MSEDPFWRMMASTEHDPQGLNLYAYCVNNPIRYRDPSGLTIVLSGDKDDAVAQLKALNQLTNHHLKARGNATNGWTVYIYKEATEITLTAGNTLIENMIKHDNTVTISNWNEPNGFASIDGKQILFNPNYQGTGGAHIVMAHELIHIDRIWREQTLEGNGTHEYFISQRTNRHGQTTFKTGTQTTLREELATVGLGGFDFFVNGTFVQPQQFITAPGQSAPPSFLQTGNITENNIRAEHGIPLRTKY